MRYVLTTCTNFNSGTAKLGSMWMHNAMQTKCNPVILMYLFLGRQLLVQRFNNKCDYK